jgi:hypothetical protein
LLIFFEKLFFEFFCSKKITFFSELRKCFWYIFDVKISDLSIYDVYRAFGAQQICSTAPTSTVRVQEPVQFRGFSEYQCESTVFAVMSDQFLVGPEKIFFSDLSTAQLKNVKNKCIRP